MSYVKQIWQDYSTLYPASAARMSHIEDGIDAAQGKPTTALIQYVTTNGDDAKDGLSWATAKQTVFAAQAALVDGGLIRLGDGTITDTQTTVLQRTNVLMNKRLTIEGNGPGRTTWTRSVDVPLLQIKGVDGTAICAEDVTIKNLTMDGKGPRDAGLNFATPILDTKSTNHVTLKDARFYNVNGTGIAAVAPENWFIHGCRFSAMGLGTAAGFAITNGGAGELEANGVKWVECDFEVNYLGRDLSIIGTSGKLASNFVFTAVKFESTPGPSYAPNERVYLEYVDDCRFDPSMKWIRGSGAHVRCVNCIDVVIAGGKSHDCQGQYAFDFESGGPYKITDVTIQGSQAMSDLGGAHIRIGATAIVKVGTHDHVVIGTEATLLDQAGAGRHVALTRDVAASTSVFGKAGFTANATTTCTTAFAAVTEIPVERAGRVIGLRCRNDAALTAGTVTVKVTKNGTATTVLTAYVTGDRTKTVNFPYATAPTFAVNDRIGVQLVADAAATPTTPTFVAEVIFVPDPILTA